MNVRNLKTAAVLSLPLVAALLAPAGIAGCDDDRRRHNTVIVAPEGRHDDRDQDRRREADRNEHRDRQEHRDRD
jgi:hypothetical protein